jgi:hypothetical protein
LNIDKLAQDMGFASPTEMSRLISMVNLASPERRTAYLVWRQNDGTKAGLLVLLKLIEVTVTDNHGKSETKLLPMEID